MGIEEVERLWDTFTSSGAATTAAVQFQIAPLPLPEFRRERYQQVRLVTNRNGVSVGLRKDTKRPQAPDYYFDVTAQRIDKTEWNCCEKCSEKGTPFVEAHHRSSSGDYVFDVRVNCAHTEGRKRRLEDDIYLKFQLTPRDESKTVIDLGRHLIAFCATRGDNAPKQTKLKFFHSSFSVTRFLRRFFAWHSFG